MKLQFNQFVFAREYRGYTQSELSRSIEGLSQSNLSKFEKGLGVLSEDVLNRIISFLNFPEDFFYKTINHQPQNAHYRKRSVISKKQRLEIERSNCLLGFLVDQMTESIEWPDFTFKAFDIEDGFTPEYIANYTRTLLRLRDDEPLKNIFTLLEKNGIIIIESDAPEKFDGVSFLTDFGNPIIIINRNFSNDRKRFTLAHELGHIVMHITEHFPISRDVKTVEQEANRFASEFLMPASKIHNSLRNLRMSHLAELKRYWLTSMSSIIRRAYDLKCIDSDKYRYLNMELSRDGKKRKEDIDVYIDRPSLFQTAYKMHKDDLSYSDDELVEAFCLPDDVFQRFFNTRMNQGKLKIVI